MLSDELLNTLGPSQQSGWIEVYDLTGPNVVLTRARRAQLVKENSSLPTANPSSTVPVIKQEPLAAGLPSMYTDACADGQSNKDDMVVPSVDADCMASQADMPTKIDGETQRKLQAKITSKNEMFSSIRKRCRKKKGACWNTKKSWTYKYSSGDRVRIFPGQCQTDSIAEVPETSPEFSPSPTQRYAGSSEPNQSVSYAKRLPTTFRRCQQDSITGTQCLSATNLDVMASVQPGLDAGIDTQIIPVAVDSTVANAGAEVPGADPTTVERTFPIVNEVPESTTAETTAAASSSPLKRALKVHMKVCNTTVWSRRQTDHWYNFNLFEGLG
ncbi:hypothetical protein SARC_06984 [Sphaeroforma arctica JP610]|uniref:Uncharacterized protein n=1 Tax=Sphaeroforma arctica JP610 TaxID=667725 RepID=A0A0L0FUZ8_9EUKA|nr:hypothetical protein SARC_06984 [Sphaeroforma arctica JP610]KNC80670.1 hypothetical protein SARC_06984 [Sphaeroforma arctica JP610]|eukprot:XP_014154572.1 hypothetical protein SARC_06984 [Sphaeroforma arctica JP610]